MNDYLISAKDQIYNIWQADKTSRLYYNEHLRNFQIVRLIEQVPGKFTTLTDLGCGTGKLVTELAGRHPEVKITAVDLSPDRLALFAEMAGQLGITQIQADLFNLNISPARVIVSQEVIEHLPDVHQTLTRMAAFLEQGSHAVFCVPNRENLEAKMITDPVSGQRYHKNGHLHSFTRKSFTRAIQQAGFDVIKIRLNTNNKLVKRLAGLKTGISYRLIFWDRLVNFLFPGKAAYLAVLCRKR